MKRYIAIDLIVAKQYHLKLNDWALLENIHFMCNNESGYCYASKETLGESLQLSGRTVFTMISKLESKGFIVKTPNNYLKVSNKWIAIANGNTAKISGTMKKLHSSYEKTAAGTMKKLHIKEDIKDSNKGEARAIDFLTKESPVEYEAFLMQNKKQINNFDKFIQDFNDTVDQEELKYITKILMARLNKYARNWIANQSKFSDNPEIVKNHPMLRKIG